MTSAQKKVKKKNKRWQKVQLRMARKAAAFRKTQQPRKIARIVPSINKAKFRKAIKDSAGNKTVIAERLGCCRGTVDRCLKREEWADVLEEYNQELEYVADLAEAAVKDAIEQRMDMSTASRTAQWLLTRQRHKDRRMGDESKVVVEGGDKPIQHLHNTVPIETLDLPVELRRQILDHMETKAREAQEKAKEQPRA